jgi:hypothetical protein
MGGALFSGGRDQPREDVGDLEDHQAELEREVKITRRTIAPVLLFAAGAIVFAAGDVVVIKGGARIELQKPLARQGNVVLLTRSDGALLSVPAADIDWKATEAARNAARAPAKGAPAVEARPETPAQAARAGRNGPKARVKLTDADVGHATDEEPASGAKKDVSPPSGSGRLEVIDYQQEKSGGNLTVRGSIRNSDASPAANARMTVTAMDEKGEKIATGEAGLSSGVVEPGGTVSFSVTIPVGERFVGSIRFAPQWLVSAPSGPVAAAPTPAALSPSAAKPPSQQSPAPAPTPYGRGNLYAAPAPSASTTPPADGKTGYLPNMSSPENQPKPPN